MAHSTVRGVSLKPGKDWRKAWGLHPDFPLFPHGDPDKPERLRWCKKVKKKLKYFGKVEGDPKGVKALEVWLRDKDDLIAGRTPRAAIGGLTLRELCNKFLASKRTAVDLGKLSPRTFVEYSRTTDFLIDSFGRDRPVLDLRPDDFEELYAKLAKRHGLTTVGREVTMVRSVFRYGVESDLIERAVKFGPAYKAPSKADKRKHKARQKSANGAKMFKAAEVRALLAAESRTSTPNPRPSTQPRAPRAPGRKGHHTDHVPLKKPPERFAVRGEQAERCIDEGEPLERRIAVTHPHDRANGRHVQRQEENKHQQAADGTTGTAAFVVMFGHQESDPQHSARSAASDGIKPAEIDNSPE